MYSTLDNTRTGKRNGGLTRATAVAHHFSYIICGKYGRMSERNAPDVVIRLGGTMAVSTGLLISNAWIC